MLELWRERLLWLMVLLALSLAAGGTVIILHGALLRCRIRCSHSLAECVPCRSPWIAVLAGLAAVLLLTQAETLPWEWLGTLALLVFTAPALLAQFGPPEEHVEASRLCQIGRGSVYSHYYGYLRLMREEHEARERLEAFKRDNPSGMSADVLEQFFSDAVMVLTPADGKYPDKPLSALRDNELPGVSSKSGCVPYFQCKVGGNTRSYGAFSVHKVTSSDGHRSRYVALDKVGALGTLRRLREHGPAGLKPADCQKQMDDMIDELKKIVADRDHLRDQVKVVYYKPREHVGDAILAAVQTVNPATNI